MILGAIFDVDGTLLDSMSIWENAGARYLQSIQVQAEPGLNEVLYPLTIEEGVSYMKSHYALSKSEAEISEGLLSVVRDFYYYEVPLKSGVLELLQELSRLGIPMVIATAGYEQFSVAAMKRLGIWQYFTGITTCSSSGINKREPDFFIESARPVLDRIGIAGESISYKDILVFEDAIHAIETAKKAGFTTVAVKDDSNLALWERITQIADHSYENINEAMELIK